MNEIEMEIERLRKLMYQANHKNQNQFVLEISIKLDTLLNQFEKEKKIQN